MSSHSRKSAPHHSPPAHLAHRARHRSRQHDAAHSENHDSHSAPLTHPLVASNDPVVILDDSGLAELLGHLRNEGRFAYDSEFIGELSYHPRLCLIQVATTQRIALIDPFSDLDLTPFWELLADPAVEKIVHAGAQDLEPVVRHLNRAPANVIDVQVAAGFVGLTYPLALSKLVQEVVGVRLGKSWTFTDWSQRPLSRQQLRYAADDVRYLPAVRDELGRRLQTLGHTAHLQEECSALCEPSQYLLDLETDHLRVRGAGTLSPRELALLKKLFAWREQLAREHDVPPRAYLKDEILVDLSRRPAKTLDKLDNVKGLPRPVQAEQGQRIIELTLAALSEPPPAPSKDHEDEPTPPERFKADALWAAAQVLCAGQSIDPALATSRQEIGELDRAFRRKKDISTLRLMNGWRRELLGEPLVRLLRSESNLRVRWEEDVMKTTSA